MSARGAIAGVILAGGQSRRMGENKALLRLAGTTLMERALERLRPQVSRLALNLHEAVTEVPGLPVVLDEGGDHQGPLAGILAALRWAEQEGFRWVATAAVDTPFFPTDLVQGLSAAAQDKTMAAASSGGRLHPVFGVWDTDARPALETETANGLRSARQWVAHHDAGIVDWPAEPFDPFFNINQPDDVTRAAQILAEFTP